MTTATLIKKTFNFGCSPTVSEVQSIIFMMGRMVVCRQIFVLEWSVLHLPGKSTEILGCILSIGTLKARPHSDRLPPTRSHPLQQSHTF